MATVKFKCIADEIHCGKEFEPGNWECMPGVLHQVAPKTYYMADAPYCDFKRDADGMAFRSSRTRLHAIPDDQVRDERGNQKTVSYQPVIFVQGRYETTNPREQFYLEHGTAARSLCTYEKWFDAYHTPQQKQNIKDGQLKQRERDLDSKTKHLEDTIKQKEREYNDLLAKVTAEGKKKDKPSMVGS